MKGFRVYNVIDYIKSISLGENIMYLDRILNPYKKCLKYAIDGSKQNYLQYIEDKPFYIPPTFTDVKTNRSISTVNPRFLLFSAPGATGKSALAKYIAYEYKALYWNLAQLKLGTNSFAGSILKVIGSTNYSDFVKSLKNGKALLVIDAFDEAEIISSKKMVDSFLLDINDTLQDSQNANVILFARTETAQNIAMLCVENSIPLLHYEIGFFDKTQAIQFIEESINKKELTDADKQCINCYYDTISGNLSAEEIQSFLGYAPVLEAISQDVKDNPNSGKLISELKSKSDRSKIIITILEDLLNREHEQKFIPAFQKRCQELYPTFNAWDQVYSPREQLVRLLYYVIFDDSCMDYLPIKNTIPGELIDEYNEMVKQFLPQHPFVSSSFFAHSINDKTLAFTGPAFRDYTLAKIILDPGYSELADLYFEEISKTGYTPSQIFFDCYININNNHVQSGHLAYVYSSYRAKSAALEIPFLQCTEIQDNGVKTGIINMKRQLPKDKKNEIELSLDITNKSMFFDQLINVTIDTPNLNLIIGRPDGESRISNSSVICRNLEFQAKNTVIESYDNKPVLLVAQGKIQANDSNIDVSHAKDLRISSSNINDHFKLVRYNYNFENSSDIDIVRFSYALKCIFFEFRTHKKDTLAKDAERIDNVIVGGNFVKQKVIEYLKNQEVIYRSDHLYKINTDKMQELCINYLALGQLDINQLEPAYENFSRWYKTNK